MRGVQFGHARARLRPDRPPNGVFPLITLQRRRRTYGYFSVKIPADRKEDPVAKTARENWTAVADAPFPDFDKADTEILEMTVKIAAKVQILTAEIEDKKTTNDERSVKNAKLAVEQANIRLQANELNRAEQTLASGVASTLKGFENAMDKVKAKIEAKTAHADADVKAGEVEKKRRRPEPTPKRRLRQHPAPAARVPRRQSCRSSPRRSRTRCEFERPRVALCFGSNEKRRPCGALHHFMTPCRPPITPRSRWPRPGRAQGRCRRS